MTILISQKYLEDKCVINGNTDYNLLVPVIVVCQDLKIMPLLGSDLYNQIVAQVAANSLSTDNKTLLDNYILPALLWYVAGKAPLILKFRLMNIGVVEKSNENNAQSSTDDVKLLEARYNGFAEDYAKLMVKYLEANLALYPSYSTSYGLGKTPANKDPFTVGGLYVDGYPSYGVPNDYGDFRYKNHYE